MRRVAALAEILAGRGSAVMPSTCERARIVVAAERYAAFVGLPATVDVAAPTAVRADAR